MARRVLDAAIIIVPALVAAILVASQAFWRKALFSEVFDLKPTSILTRRDLVNVRAMTILRKRQNTAALQNVAVIRNANSLAFWSAVLSAAFGYWNIAHVWSDW
jgi:hypothetical protein